MDWTDVARSWTAHVPRALARWPALDEAEVLATEGDRLAFRALLQRRLGGDDLAADAAIADWLEGLEPADAVMDETRDNARIAASARHVPPGEEPLSDDDRFGDARLPDTPVGRDD